MKKKIAVLYLILIHAFWRSSFEKVTSFQNLPPAWASGPDQD
ncbi:hypothetical protein N9B34_00390 [Akkermansiaceae bacterium]|nr:hypothetical protein [Akkermansiaceae bacterium]